MSYFLGEIPMGLVYAILAMGIFISLRILNVPDLTTEGSFGIGAIMGGIAGVCVNPFLSIPTALICGAAAGLITGFLQTKMQVHPVLAGIITMNMLYSVNLLLIHISTEKIEGVKNTNLPFRNNTIFRVIFNNIGVSASSGAGLYLKIAILFALVVILMLVLVWFFSTNTGLAVRATGNNPEMVRASSINVERTKILGLCISNALVALSGAVCAQLGGYTDFSLGNGTLIRGLAAVILGGAIIRGKKVIVGLIASALGALIYQFLVAFVVRYQIFGAGSSDMKSITIAVVMAVVLSIPTISGSLKQKRSRKGKTDANNKTSL